MPILPIDGAGTRPAFGMAGPVATTPEELEAMLEDAFIVKDAAAAADLFEVGALLSYGWATSEARGRPAIERMIASVLDEWTFVAGSDRVFQAGDLAIGVGRNVIVLRRRPDGVWELAIAILRNEEGETRD